MPPAVPPPHAESVFRTASDREVQLKVHRALWSDDFPENSLAAIEECVRAPVARTEIDIAMLRDRDFLVLHDRELYPSTSGSGPVGALTRADVVGLRIRAERGGAVTEHRVPLFSEVAALVAAIPGPTLIELDMTDVDPLPWPRVEELARMLEPVRDRFVLNGPDWNMRRLLAVDPALRTSASTMGLDWAPEGSDAARELRLPRGAYGYLDAHPLAARRTGTIADYLADRLGGMLRLVPGASEAHVRLELFEHMLDDGLVTAATLFHRAGLALDVWTLNAGTPRWRERLARVVAAGVDIVTTDTPRELAAAGAGMEE
ncbi:MAG: glycerophosphodiester phosphodiesterase family protein [Chloroflexi bacterium]|nr:glycerophosphodiester phosphodiesterase family protein [Chloroflexota bacterium]MDA1002277.1 glycerophosphodiester phosphodiesterase family protein [Chloroflexota bacterium]